MGKVTDQRQALADIAKTVGLTGYPRWPAQIEVPCALVKPIEGEYFEGRKVYEVTVLAGAVAADVDNSQDLLDQYLAEDGDLSLVAALNANKTLNGTSETLNVQGFSDYGSLDVNGTEYIGAKLTIEVWHR